MKYGIEFKWVGGACWSLNFRETNFQIVCDPVLCPKGTINRNFFSFERVTAPIYSDEEMQRTDLWLVTHNHHDHLDEFGLRFFNESSQVITHGNARKRILATGAKNITVLNWHDSHYLELENLKIKVTGVPAFHTKTLLGQKIAGGVNGYYIEIEYFDRLHTIYVTSDTLLKRSLVDEMKKLKIDTMIPNFGAAQKNKWYGPLTLDQKMLQILIEELNPKTVIPVHYDTFSHYVEGKKELLALDQDRIKIVSEGGSFLL